MRNLDFSSWQALLTTLLGLAIIALVTVGIRLLVMQTVQQRRERENRQVNERLRILIAAYKTLGGSFTGDLAVDPVHLRDLRLRAESSGGMDAVAADSVSTAISEATSSDRSRRIRDAVESALSDIILLGTEDQVRLATLAATELAAGRPVHTAELVVSLRNFIRKVLDLEPIPRDLIIPRQGPARPGGAGGRGGKARKAENKAAEKAAVWALQPVAAWASASAQDLRSTISTTTHVDSKASPPSLSLPQLDGDKDVENACSPGPDRKRRHSRSDVR